MITKWVSLVACALMTAVLLKSTSLSAPSQVADALQTQSAHELGRQVYNFRCYFCHGYSGDARTVAATYLQPAPANFRSKSPKELPREAMIATITHGRYGTAMQGFARTLSAREISAVADFIINEFTHTKALNTRYHTEANGWQDHERFMIAFPFATGEIALDASINSLTPAERLGRHLFMSACISCHDGSRTVSDGTVWAAQQ